uniref:Olfactomedin-like n=1 Tax=Kryptolebias marmoratus TaxID=37003 RepID=A0A3Q3AA86_KRYMA
EAGQAQRVTGLIKDGSCQCEVNSTLWSFPALKYEAVLQQIQTCEGSLSSLQEQENVTARLQPFQYLRNKGLYTVLSLRLLGQELSQLETDISAHTQMNNAQKQKLSKENMKTVKENLRYLKNSVESCKTIPKDFRTSISNPVSTKVSPYGKSYISGSWGKQAQMDSDGEKSSYWVQPLVNSHIYGNTMRVYQTYKDFMASVNHKDVTLAPSHSHANSVDGPSAVLYGEALYYHCYRSADVCRYDLKTNTVKRVTLPGTGVGFNNKFPYCYYDCRSNSDVDLEADETGLWALYATIGNHGNLVVSRLLWDNEAQTLNMSQTWETRVFKKAVSNAFMVCGVLYATR